MAKNSMKIEWKKGHSPAVLMAKLKGFEQVFFNKTLPDAAEEIALKWEREAKELAPHETGNLEGSLTGLAEKVAAHTVKSIVGSNVEYAPHQELGTAVMEAQPYIRPSLEKLKPWIKDRVKQAFREAEAIAS